MKTYKTVQSWWMNYNYPKPTTNSTGKIVIDCWNAALESLPKNRTYPQLQYYWDCVVDIISEWSGYTPMEVHEINKATLHPPHRTRIVITDRIKQENIWQGGADYVYISTTGNMKRQEFMDWIEFTVSPLWMFQGCPYIPKPMEKNLWESYVKESENRR